MIRMSENRHEHWTPRKRDIEQAKTACACPPDVLISKLPRDANLITGTGIRDGALVLSPSHLKYIRFPLHPLFHVVLSALDLHPMQLSPNSYLQLSAFLALGLQVGASVDCSEFFHFHDCILIREEVDYFHFASKPNCRTFGKKPSSHKNWKHRPLLITGNWAAPELNCLKIRSAFAATATNFTTSPTPERIQWLKTHLAGSCLDIKKYSTPDLLLRISQERTSFIYRLFQPAHLKLKPGLEGRELTTHIVESLAKMDAAFSECPEHVAERERMREKVEKRNRSGETDEEAVHSFEDPDRVDLDQVEPTMVRDLPDMTYSLPSKPSKLKTKRSGSSALGVKKRLKTVSDQSAHSSRTCLEPISSPTYPPLKSIPLNKEKNAALVPNLCTDVVSGHSSNRWIPKFKKDDGTFVTEEEKLVGNPEACLAVWQGLFHPADASAFQKEAPLEIMKAINSRFIEFGQMAMAIETMLTQTRQNEKLLTITNENKDKQLEALKLELKQERQRANELEGRLQKVETERDVLKVDFNKVQSELAKTEKEFKEVKDARELEFQKANAHDLDFQKAYAHDSRILEFQKALQNEALQKANARELEFQKALQKEALQKANAGELEFQKANARDLDFQKAYARDSRKLEFQKALQKEIEFQKALQKANARELEFQKANALELEFDLELEDVISGVEPSFVGREICSRLGW